MNAKTYVKPGSFKQFLQRKKRCAPSYCVDFYDFLIGLKYGFNQQYPYYVSGRYTPFFIVGSGRSGNTLLRKLIMERANVFIPPEIPGLGSTIRKFSQVSSLPWAEIVHNIIDHFYKLANIDVYTYSAPENRYRYNLANELRVEFDKVKYKLLRLSEERRSLAAIIDSIYRESMNGFCGDSDMPWGDKTPWNIFHFDRLNKVYPDAKYIHMLRDGRDCVVSYVTSLGDLMGIDYVEAAYRWRDAIRKANHIKRSVGRRFLEIRYEEMVAAPNETVERVMRFLCLSERTNKPSLSSADLGDTKAIHHAGINKNVGSQSIGRWEKILSEYEKQRIMKIIGKELEMMEY